MKKERNSKENANHWCKSVDIAKWQYDEEERKHNISPRIILVVVIIIIKIQYDWCYLAVKWMITYW